MGVNYSFKDTNTDKFLIYMITNNEKQIYGEYSDLKSLCTAMTWIGKYPSYYTNTKFQLKKVKIVVEEIDMSEDENKYIREQAAKKGIELV